MTQKILAQVLQWYKGHWFSPMPLAEVYEQVFEQDAEHESVLKVAEFLYG